MPGLQYRLVRSIWSGAIDPHGAGAYVTGGANDTQTHIAVINLENVLESALSGHPYDPLEANPQKDILYFRIP